MRLTPASLLILVQLLLLIDVVISPPLSSLQMITDDTFYSWCGFQHVMGYIWQHDGTDGEKFLVLNSENDCARHLRVNVDELQGVQIW